MVSEIMLNILKTIATVAKKSISSLRLGPLFTAMHLINNKL